VAFLDGSVVNVALPAIGREVGDGFSVLQWVLHVEPSVFGWCVFHAVVDDPVVREALFDGDDSLLADAISTLPRTPTTRASVSTAGPVCTTRRSPTSLTSTALLHTCRDRYILRSSHALALARGFARTE
jgi:hypothetical protein